MIAHWRHDEDVALGWLRYLGGEQTAAAVAEQMDVDERRAALAMTRLAWRGLAVYGSPDRGGRTTWIKKEDGR